MSQVRNQLKKIAVLSKISETQRARHKGETPTNRMPYVTLGIYSLARTLTVCALLSMLHFCQPATAKISTIATKHKEPAPEDFLILQQHQSSKSDAGEPETHAELKRYPNFSSAKPEDETSTENLLHLLDSNYLESVNDSKVASNADVTNQQVPLQNGEKISNLFGTIRKAGKVSKQQQDWWTKLMSTTKNKNKENKPPTGTTRAPVYREQPLHRNPILTAKNQLVAIRDKHRALMTVAVPQLMKLDKKLIESYKLCFKRNHPLYGGMLYRTRGFIINLARDVKQERQALEATTKQIQKTLNERISNRTLVKEYRLLSIATTQLPTDSGQQPNRKVNRPAAGTLEREGSLQSRHSAAAVTSDGLNKVSARDKEDSADSSGVVRGEPIVLEELLTEEQIVDGKRRHDPLAVNRLGAKGLPQPLSSSASLSSTSEQATKATVDRKHSSRYPVHINEVNLKKQLQKTQALIDRINASTHDISGVIDDILILLRLSPEMGMKRKGKIDRLNGEGQNNILLFNTVEQKRQRKMLKSPIKNFLEKYGKLMAENIGDFVGNNTKPADLNDRLRMTASADISNTGELYEPKPLFDPTSMIYAEPTDVDLGFDS